MANETDNQAMKIIIQAGTALPAGFLAASLQAWRPEGFVFSVATLIVFVLAAAVMIGYWRLIFSSLRSAWKVLGTVLVGGLGIFGFLYPIRFVAPNKYPEITTGLITALVALSGVAAFMYCCRLIFHDDSK
ncbi:MAG: hypothetical protein ACK4UN_00875 [Limisphaerales bacterium]